MLAAVQRAATELTSHDAVERAQRVGAYGTALVMSLLTAFPLYLLFVVAFQPPDAVFGGGRLDLIPSTVSLRNFELLFGTTDTTTYLVNSVIVTAGTTVVATGVSVVAGYLLTRFEFSGKTFLSRSIFLSYMFSAIVIAIPLYILYTWLGLLNSHLGLIMGLTAFISPFNIWLMWQYFETVPISLEERAWIEGASRFRAVRDVVLPVARPGIITAAIFAFSASWNDYTLAQIVLSESSMYTLPVGSELFLGRTADWGMRMAVSVIMCIPPFLIALFFQKYLMLGINIGETG